MYALVQQQMSQNAAAASAAPAAAATGAHAGAEPELVLSSLSSSLVPAWLDHCALCFKDKKPFAPPRSYFETHLRQDPMLDLNGVAVLQAPPVAEPKAAAAQEDEEKAAIQLQGRTAEQAAKEAADEAAKQAAAAAAASAKRVIAATARVFVRRMYVAGDQITFGGIGEVCTHPAHRSKGYADLCLARCMQYHRLLRLQVSSLHASGAMAAFYAQKGFVPVPRYFAAKSDFESEAEAGRIIGEGARHGPFSLRLMPLRDFFAPSMLPQFCAMYSQYVRPFNGPVVRDDEAYWRNWVRSNLEAAQGSQTAFPIDIYATFEEYDGSEPLLSPAAPIRFLSYMFLQRQHIPADEVAEKGEHDRVYLVREYAASANWGHAREDKGRLMFLSLIQYAVRQIRHHMAQVDPAAAAQAKITVRFPWALAASFPTPLRIDEGSLRADEGFMFQPLPVPGTEKDLSADPAAAAALAATAAAEEAALRAGRTREFNGRLLEEGPLTSPFAASPFVLHHNSEELGPGSAQRIVDKLMQDAKERVLFFNTDSF